MGGELSVSSVKKFHATLRAITALLIGDVYFCDGSIEVLEVGLEFESPHECGVRRMTFIVSEPQLLFFPSSICSLFVIPNPVPDKVIEQRAIMLGRVTE